MRFKYILFICMYNLQNRGGPMDIDSGMLIVGALLSAVFIMLFIHNETIKCLNKPSVLGISGYLTMVLSIVLVAASHTINEAAGKIGLMQMAIYVLINGMGMVLISCWAGKGSTFRPFNFIKYQDIDGINIYYSQVFVVWREALEEFGEANRFSGCERYKMTLPSGHEVNVQDDGPVGDRTDLAYIRLNMRDTSTAVKVGIMRVVQGGLAGTKMFYGRMTDLLMHVSIMFVAASLFSVGVAVLFFGTHLLIVVIEERNISKHASAFYNEFMKDTVVSE